VDPLNEIDHALLEETYKVERAEALKNDYETVDACVSMDEFVERKWTNMGDGIVEKLGDSNLYLQRTSVLGDVDRHGKRKKYTIAVRKADGRWTCACMHWKTRCNAKEGPMPGTSSLSTNGR
jgi:hypothetical protein